MGHLANGFNTGGVVRQADEEHRVSTPLELLFDLCFVVAVAQAADGLYELLVEWRAADAGIGFFAVFFAIWWAWVLAGSGLVIAFAAWWGYFGRNDVPRFDRLHGAFMWGDGHGLAWIVRTSGRDDKRPTTTLLLAAAVALVALGLVVPPEPALLATAALLVIGTIAQTAMVRRAAVARA